MATRWKAILGLQRYNLWEISSVTAPSSRPRRVRFLTRYNLRSKSPSVLTRYDVAESECTAGESTRNRYFNYLFKLHSVVFLFASPTMSSVNCSISMTTSATATFPISLDSVKLLPPNNQILSLLEKKPLRDELLLRLH
ncbi:hypothetical protein SAY86_018450 [Trapa natans]|uniref:Uncharacterized protein n=1 Tax=Trapa natans TaxID=22666 RepID=A0AAN7QYU3_TRANT|nr:hypothetical protein SAY86_018450 [Trapa natans]